MMYTFLQRRPMKKKIIIAVCFLAIIQSSPFSQQSENKTLEKWVDTARTFSKDPVDIKWHNSGDLLAFLWNENGDNFYDIYSFNPSDKKRERLTDSIALEMKRRYPDDTEQKSIAQTSGIKTAGITEFVWHPKNKDVYFIFAGDIYRLSTEDKKVTQVIRTVAQESCIKLSPDGKWISFIRANDIWVLGLENGSEIQLTDTGSDFIINGRFVYPKWKTPEQKPAYEWNSLSSAIAFITTDISQAAPGFNADKFYQGLADSSIPNPFTPIPKYKVSAVFLHNFKTVQLTPETNTDKYITKILWRPVSLDLLILQEDRTIKKVSYLLVNTFTADSRLLLTEENPQSVNTENRFVLFSKEGTTLYYTSEEDGWNHLYSLNIKNTEKRKITNGEWEITALQGIDNKKNIYLTTTRIRPNQRHLEVVSADSGIIEQITYIEGCHRCILSPSFTEAAEFFESNFIAGDMFYFAFNRPYNRFRITSPDDQAFSGLLINEPRYITINSIKDDGRIYARLWQPTNNIEEPSPAIILIKNSYSMPTVLRTLDKKDIFSQIFTEQGYYILELDHRGTSGYGKKWRTDNYERNGELDRWDIMSGLEYLESQPFIDHNRIGLMGSGYGAYLTLQLISKNNASFRAALAFNPLLLWEKYDTRFVESVFGHPSMDNNAYKNFEITSNISDLNSKLLVLINSDRSNDRQILLNQYFIKLLEDSASFDLRYFSEDKLNEKNYDERIRIISEILAFFKEKL